MIGISGATVLHPRKYGASRQRGRQAAGGAIGRAVRPGGRAAGIAGRRPGKIGSHRLISAAAGRLRHAPGYYRPLDPGRQLVPFAPVTLSSGEMPA
jgi:hypothetical protein